jgi:hypothetical protein
MNRLLLGTLASLSLAVAAAPAALAQAPQAQSATERQAERHGKGHRGAERAFRAPTERVEARLAYIRTALKITDAQTPQWESFAQTMRGHAQEAEKRMQARRAGRAERPREGRPTAIDRLERRQARLAASATRIEATLNAAKPLYAALSAEQQRVADQLLSPRQGSRFHPRSGSRRS